MKGRFEGVGGQGFWGNCTHLGQFEGKAQGGLTYWYAANGDWIAWQVTAFIPGESNPPISNFQLVQTIVDGSGRFKGAKGTVTLDIFQNDLTKEFDGTIDGTISRPNSGKK